MSYNKSKVDRIRNYPRVNNRLMVVDWASLSYHQLHTLKIEQLIPRSYTMLSITFNGDGFYLTYPDDTCYHIFKNVDGSVSNKRIDITEYNALETTEYPKHNFAKLSEDVQREILQIETGKYQINVWRNSIISRMLEYIQLFNPKDLIFALEGTQKPWRNKLISDYYKKPGKVRIEYSDCGKFTMVYYDLSKVLLVNDNLATIDSGTNAKYNISTKEAKETGADRFVVEESGKNKIANITQNVTFGNELDFFNDDVSILPKKVKDFITKSIVPSYKGNRKDSEWNFAFNKSEWNLIRADFAKFINRYFKCAVVEYEDAEGDDVVYVAVNNNKLKYDDVIIVTRDSDMDQLIDNNVQIFNHVDHAMKVNHDPFTYIQTKVLAGDSSDNIPGMILPGKKTKLADAGAKKYWNECGYDPLTPAKNEGWEDQYLRNRDLIVLDYMPTEIKSNVGTLIENAMNASRTLDVNTNGTFNEQISGMFSRLRSNGYHVLNEGETQLNKSQYFHENEDKDFTVTNSASTFSTPDQGSLAPSGIDSLPSADDWGALF